MDRILRKRRFIIGFSMAISASCFAQYHETDHRQISGNEVAVKTPGSYAEKGIVYVLANDISSAPGVKVVNTADVHVFLGEKLLSLQEGDEITSPYVEDEQGNEIQCIT